MKTISLGKRATTLSGGVAWGVGGGAEGSHLPSSSWQPTAGLLRRGFHWRHEFLSLVTGTTEGHVMKEHRKSTIQGKRKFVLSLDKSTFNS